MNFTVAISTYTTDLEEQLEAGIEQDENDRKLQAKVKKKINRKSKYRVHLE